MRATQKINGMREQPWPLGVVMMAAIMSACGSVDTAVDTPTNEPEAARAATNDSINNHPVVVDSQNKLLTWMVPAETAYDQFLHKRWNFIKHMVPDAPGPEPRSNYRLYYFYDGYITQSPIIEPDNWMNDVGEKIPNWFESARLYYAYTGDMSVMQIVKELIDYALEHGTSPAEFAWPRFPYTTTNPGDLDFRGFTGRFALHEIQVDHAADMGFTYWRMYQFFGDTRYRTAALDVANVLAAKAKTGTATESVWPYRVRMDTGEVTAPFGSNWIGAYALLDSLIKANQGNVNAYRTARNLARTFILQQPLKTGYWVDGHTDNAVNSNTYKSNMSKSNAALYILDNEAFDPNRATDIPAMIEWTETWFVNRTSNNEPATEWGANVVGEQDDFNYKMDYQTARYAAECAKWYALSGDESYKEKAFRSLNWVTYTNDENGRATESPYSLGIASWFSDCYGEAPRMFYHVFGAIPEWAPPRENHILYSQGVLKNVSYGPSKVQYTATDANGVEFLRVRFEPTTVSAAGVALAKRSDLRAEGYTVRDLGGGDYVVSIRHTRKGVVSVTGIATNGPPTSSITSPASNESFPAQATITITADARDADGSVAKVEFLVGGNKIGEDATSPYTFTWTNVAQGSYTLTVRATDNQGAWADSAAVRITVGGTRFILGNDSVGTADDSSGAHDLNCWRVQASNSFDATNMRIYLRDPVAGRMRLAIYSDASGVPGNLLASSQERTNPGSGWVDFPLEQSQTITSGTFFWLAAWSNGNYTPKQSPGGLGARYRTVDYGATNPWPSQMGPTSGPYSGVDSIYAWGMSAGQ